MFVVDLVVNSANQRHKFLVHTVKRKFKNKDADVYDNPYDKKDVHIYHLMSDRYTVIFLPRLGKKSASMVQEELSPMITQILSLNFRILALSPMT